MKWLLCFLIAGCAVPSKTEPWCLPKRVTRTIATLITLAFGATFANAADGISEREVPVHCENGICALRESDLTWIQQSNQELAKRLAEAEAKIKAPECAKVEVVPPKKLPPIKAERNS